MGYLTDSNGRPDLPCELCPFVSPTDGSALPFVLNICFSPPLAPHPPVNYYFNGAMNVWTD